MGRNFSEVEPICNSDIFMTDGDTIWLNQSYDGFMNDINKPTHWISLLDFEADFIAAKEQVKYHCKPDTCGNKK